MTAQSSEARALVSSEPSSPLEVLAFRHYMAGVAAVTMANQLQGTVVAYQVYELTHSPLSLGAIGLAEALPFISLALLGGYFADRHDRRRLSLVVLVAATALSVVLLGLTLGRGHLSGGRHVVAIYSVIALLGVCRSFLQPARAALNAEVLPTHLYAKAIAIRTSVFQLAMVSGPALGGVLYAAIGPGGAYTTAAALLAFAWVQTFLIPRVRTTPFHRTDKSFLHGVREGFRYLASDRLLLPAVLVDLFAVLFGGATALLPVFANEILKVGSRGFGLLRAAPAVGALTASLVLASRPPLKRAGRALLWAVAGYGVATIGFGLSKSFGLSVALLVAAGAFDMVSVVVRSTLLQLRVPGHLLGRIASINQIFIGSSNEIGAFESGVAARLLGTVSAVVLGGGVTLVVAATAATRARELRDLGALDQWTLKS
ncbi:MAG TPA: MFS transporter [Polyangiaceae bacterium]|nr:MFS transporter [Polyangiaceae bacterium]